VFHLSTLLHVSVPKDHHQVDKPRNHCCCGDGKSTSLIYCNTQQDAHYEDMNILFKFYSQFFSSSLIRLNSNFSLYSHTFSISFLASVNSSIIRLHVACILTYHKHLFKKRINGVYIREHVPKSLIRNPVTLSSNSKVSCTLYAHKHS
jgi:hypothetical protein